MICPFSFRLAPARRFALLLAAGFALSPVSARCESGKSNVRADSSGVLLQTEYLVYAIGKDGINRAFQDRRTGRSYLDKNDPGHFMSVRKDGKWVGSTAVKLDRGFLLITFGDSGVRAKVHVRSFPSYLTLELIAVNDHAITSFQLSRLSLTLTQHVSYSLTSCRNDEYAAAVIPLNIKTHSYPTRGKPAVPTGVAEAAVRFGGAKGAVVGGPAA